MRLHISPLIPYALGAVLVVFGVLRVKYLAAPRPPNEPVDEADGGKDTTPVRGPLQRRHLRWGVINILLGLFLLVWTYVETHRQ